MALPVLDARLEQHAAANKAPALIFAGENLSYRQLLVRIEKYAAELTSIGLNAADPVLLSCGFEPDSVAMFLALLRHDAIAVLNAPNDPRVTQKIDACQPRLHLQWPLEKSVSEHALLNSEASGHPLVKQLRDAQHPGFVVFSSGSSGEPKAVLHDAQRFTVHLQKVEKAKSTIGFLAFDHIAGIDTLLYTLFAGGTLIVPTDRSPESVCSSIEEHEAQVLPVSPSFLKLLLVSPALKNYDLSSLEIVTFGSEAPDPTVIDRLGELMPTTTLLQKYGTSEFGAPRSKTRPGDSRWIKLSSDNFATRVIDDVLWVKATGTMLGYLNVATPEAQEGWYCTGDRVETDGEWLRILGRESDMINVGGEKVFPAEVESVIETLPGILECAVRGEAHSLLGNVVVATVRLDAGLLAEGLSTSELKQRVRRHCRSQLPRHAIPVKVKTTTTTLTTERGKRLRK